MYIYADMIFIINLLMNSIILLLTAWAAGIEYKWWRIATAAIVGSCYVLVGILPSMIFIHHAFFKIIMSLILIVLAFGMKPRRILLVLVAFFYVIAFILGGAIAGWLYFYQTGNYFATYDMVFANLSWVHLILGSCLGVLLTRFALRRMLSYITRKQNLYEVKLEYEGKAIELTGMLDTGNGLYTVIGRRPVILASLHAIEPILSQQVVEFLRSYTPETWLANLDKCMDLKWISRIQIIPYHAIGSKSMLLGFPLDHLIISTESGGIYVSDVVIAIYSGTLSGDGTYSVLLHPQIMNELSKKEGVSVCA